MMSDWISPNITHIIDTIDSITTTCSLSKITWIQILSASILLIIYDVREVQSQTFIEPLFGYGLSKSVSSNKGLFRSHVISDEKINNGFMFYGLASLRVFSQRFQFN